jgi:Asp-tRNA(Asn)/Glu-tRNA(Gln) amidotransferase C subunit
MCASVTIEFEFTRTDGVSTSISEEEIDLESDEGRPARATVTDTTTMRFGDGDTKEAVLDAFEQYVERRANEGYSAAELRVLESSIMGMTKEELEQTASSTSIDVTSINYVDSVQTEHVDPMDNMPERSRSYSIRVRSREDETIEAFRGNTGADLTTGETVDTKDELIERLSEAYRDQVSTLRDRFPDDVIDDHEVEITLAPYYKDKVSEDELRELCDETGNVTITFD